MTILHSLTNLNKTSLKTALRLTALGVVAASVTAMSASAQNFTGGGQDNTLLAAAASPAAFAGIAKYERLSVPSGNESSSATADAKTSSSVELPDAPSAVLFAEAAPVPETMDRRPVDSSPTAPFAPRFTKYIPSNQRGMKISAGDKIVLGLKDVVSPFSILGIIVDAGYSQVTNGEPNYGVDKGAFGERLWATAVRDSTEGFFTDSVMAPILHEDPRYYVEGPQFSFVHRTLYAATRPLITRTDSGHSSVNGALLIGYVFAAALSYAYYPKSNQTFHDTASTYGGSIGGAALGDFVSEFADDILQKFHLEKAH